MFSALHNKGYHYSKNDYSLFIKKSSTSLILVAAYVDDVLIIPIAYGLAKLTTKKEVWEELKNKADEEIIEVRKIDKIVGGCVVGTLTLALLSLIIYLIIR